MKRVRFLAMVTALALLYGCNASRIPGVWKTYSHPTYKFSFKHPRNWKIEEGGTFGTLLNLIPPEDDSLFRANANLVVEQREEKIDLKLLADRSQLQLSKLLLDYQVLAFVPVKFGNLDAFEVRGKYKGSEGERIIRTWIAYAADNVYVFTFTSRVEREIDHAKTLESLLNSMVIPTN